MKEIEDNTNQCLKFRPKTIADDDWMEIEDNEEGCFADLGFLGPNFGKHRLNIERTIDELDPKCTYKEVIVHELLHVLGVRHEQNRPDRDEYIEINWPKMQVIKICI